MAVSAQAEVSKVTWIGTQFNNGASAVRLFDIDTNLFPELGGDSNFDMISLGFPILSLTIQASAGGNGTFGQSDFYDFVFSAFSPLNYTQELIGYSMTNGFNFGGFDAGHKGPRGDFNLFANSETAPNGTYFFVLSNSGGDAIGVTSIAPFTAGAVPEPADWAMLLSCFGLTGTAMRRSKAVVA